MSLPDMSGALWGVTEPMQFNVVKTSPVDGEANQVVTNAIVFEGIMEPLTPQLLWIKPEGERKWKWWTMWTEQDLNVGDIVQDEQGILYRVMKEWDWRTADYQQYEIIETPKPPYAGQ